MEPFSISCTTCQAKLRVRDESAIGQIKTCPKCGSMVLIEAPARPDGDTADREKPKVPVNRPGRQPPPLPGASKKSNEFADTVEDPTHYGTANAPESATDAQPTDNDDFSSEIAFDEPTTPNEANSADLAGADTPDEKDWEPAGSQTRRWLLAGAAMIGGVGLAIAIFVYLASRGSAQVANSNANSPAKTTGQVTPNPETKPAAKSNASQDSTMPSTAVPPPPTASSPVATSEDPTNTTDRDSVPGTPVTIPQPSAPQATTEPDARDPGKEKLPPDLTPSDGDKAKAESDKAKAESDKAKADRLTPSGSLSDTLRKLGGLFDETSEAPKPDAPPVEPVPTAATAPAAPAATETPKLARPAPRTIDLDARLADQIVEIEFTETPLQDFLQFVSTLSTIPISLDPDVLVWLKLTPNTPITLKLSATTVEQLLNTALEKLGLVAVPVKGQLVVTSRATAGSKVRQAQRNVADLVGTDLAQAANLLQQIKSLIAPDSWVESGGKGTIQFANGMLEMEQAETVLLDISTFLERLRVARGLPKKSPFEERIFQPISRTARAAPQLNKSVTLNYSRPTQFSKIVRRLAQEAGVSLLIDWQALAAAGWNPDAQTTLSVTTKSLGETLTALLQPMELAYRIVDESTIQITTPAEIETRQELEFYRVDSLLTESSDSDALIKRIASALPPGTFADGMAKDVLQFDAPSRCLLVLLPQSRQQDLEKLLTEWTSTAK